MNVLYYIITNNITQRELVLQTKEKPIVVIGLTYQIDDIKVVLIRKGKNQLRCKTQICS